MPREGVIRIPRRAVSEAELARAVSAAARAGAEAAVRAHRARQARERFLAAVDEYDEGLPPAVRSAVLGGTRAADDDVWVQAQIAKRSAYQRRLAESLGLTGPDAIRILADARRSPLAV